MDSDIFAANSVSELQELSETEKVRCEAWIESIKHAYSTLPESLAQDAAKALEDAFALVQNPNLINLDTSVKSRMYQYAFRLAQIEIKLALLQEGN